MGRFLGAGILACTALVLLVAPVRADGQGEIEKLRQEVKELKASMLEQDIGEYLKETEGLKGVQGGGGMSSVTIHAAFTSNFMATIGVDNAVGADDVGVVDGSVDLSFDFQVTDNMVLFINMTANNGGAGTLPVWWTVGGPTLAGLADGIGVDGTVPTKPGSVITREAGIRVKTPISNGEFNWEMGEIDARSRFLQNPFAGNNYTQFINNQFNDPSSVPWLTNAGGTVSLGWHVWFDLGANKQHTINFGWFNTPGQWFSAGQFMAQYTWTGEVSGRQMHIRAMGWYSEHAVSGGTADSSTGGGVEWDWMATDKIAVFITIVANDSNNTVPTDFDGSFGMVLHGVGSRPDDRLGVAVGFIQANDSVPLFAGTDPDLEFTVEIYYTYSTQDGKLQVTPYVQYVDSPGGGSTVLFPTEDSLFLVGVRIHVPF